MWMENTAVIVFAFYLGKSDHTSWWTSATGFECAISWSICSIHFLLLIVLLPDAILVKVGCVVVNDWDFWRLHENTRVGFHLQVPSTMLDFDFVLILNHLNPSHCIFLQFLHGLVSFVARINIFLRWNFHNRVERFLVIDNISFKLWLFSPCTHRLSDGSERAYGLDYLVISFFSGRWLWCRHVLHRTPCTWMSELSWLIRYWFPSRWHSGCHSVVTISHVRVLFAGQLRYARLLSCTVTNLISSDTFRLTNCIWCSFVQLVHCICEFSSSELPSTCPRWSFNLITVHVVEVRTHLLSYLFLMRRWLFLLQLLRDVDFSNHFGCILRS